MFFSLRPILAAFILLVSSNHVFADGSKDLYPSGKTGYRAYLRSSLTVDASYPFPTTGTHYVYAKEGEKILLASSAQLATTTSAIQLYNPAGTQVVNDATVAGQIPNRAAELAGPQLTGTPTGGRYAPIYYTVPTGGDGIYRVEFLARGIGNPGTIILANANWTQGTDSGIFAWDISVTNSTSTAFIPGRVYSNVFNLSNGITTPENVGFEGIFYVLTKDGYNYRVKNNGNNGLYFTFFVNNNGFLNTTTQLPLYKSLNTSTLSASNVQNPKNADTVSQITHKMFYTLPDPNLPTSSIGAVPGNSTWLKNGTTSPTISALSLQGVEGVGGQVSNKGGYVKFTTTSQGNYLIIIKSTGTPSFVTRVISGTAAIGANSILWDGKDGNGAALPSGTFPTEISVQFQGGEVHFPFIDMEYNKNGFNLELLDNSNLNTVISDFVYWDDSPVSNATNSAIGPKGNYSDPKINTHLTATNLTGISSSTNGHIWGQGSTGTSGQFGDNKSIDTWTFVKGPVVKVTTPIVVKIADLKISQLTANTPIIKLAETLTLTVKVKNDGPDPVTGSKFTFTLPIGLDPQSLIFNGNSCGTESVAITYNSTTRTYTSNLNLPNACEITYTFNVKVTPPALVGNQTFKATILRPNDITDPDATNTDITIPPTDAQFECTNNGLGGSCNNIASLNVLYPACYEPGTVSGLGTDTKMGITLLKRAGNTSSDNWPMVRKSGFVALESNSRGFVITRIDKANLGNIASPQEGMMVYDNTDKCLKIYSDGAWKCFSQIACP